MSAQGTPAATAGGASAGVSGDYKEIADLARTHNMQDRLADWIGQGASLAQVRDDILKSYQSRSDAVLRAGGQGAGLDFSEREAQSYSFARAVKLQLDGGNGFEREVSEELYKKLGRNRSNPNAMLVPHNILAMRERARMQRNMAVANTTSGQQLRFDEPGGFLEILRNRMFVAQFGATMLSGLQNDISFVTNPSANTFQWGAETGGATATFLGTGIKTMAPKNGAAYTKYTRQLLAQSVYAIDGIVENDLMKIIALALDRAAIVAGGGNAPVGILGTTGIGAVTMGANGAAITSIDKLVDLETELAIDNADFGSLGYMTTPRVRGQLRKVPELANQIALPIWQKGSAPGIGEVAGYKAAATNQVPSNLTKGTNTGVCHAVIFGDWSDLVIGEWGATELIVDPYSAKPNLIEVAAHVMADVMVRYPEKFAAIPDVLVS